MTTLRDFPMEGVPRRMNAAAVVVDMAGATHTLTYGTPGSAETQLVGEVVVVDANGTGGGTSGQTLHLPTGASASGRRICIFNQGGESVTLDDTESTVLPSGGTIVVDSATLEGTLYWIAFDKGQTSKIKRGQVTMTSGTSTATASVGALYNGKPVVATFNATDGTKYIVSAVVSSGTLTITASANTTADRVVNYIIDGR